MGGMEGKTEEEGKAGRERKRLELIRTCKCMHVCVLL